MAVGRLAERNVRPGVSGDLAGSEDDTTEEGAGQHKDIDSSDGDESGSGIDADGFAEDTGFENGGESADDDVAHEISNVSFGALLEAQNALSRKRKRGSETTMHQDAKLDALRSRLQEIRSKKNSSRSSRGLDDVAKGRSKRSSTEQSRELVTRSTKDDKHRNESGSDDEDSDSVPSEEEPPTRSRTSKHAPASQSSRHQVTRKRTVIDIPKRVIRDPRFDATNQQSHHPNNNNNNSEKAYSFLRDYEKSEIAELKAALKQTKDEAEKDLLRRKLNSMQNRIKSQEAKEREQEVLRKHRKEESEKVEQGKRPFFLKRGDVKERAAVEGFRGLKKRDQTKVVEKRKRRESQRERRRMPGERRVVE